MPACWELPNGCGNPNCGPCRVNRDVPQSPVSDALKKNARALAGTKPCEIRGPLFIKRRRKELTP